MSEPAVQMGIYAIGLDKKGSPKRWGAITTVFSSPRVGGAYAIAIKGDGFPWSIERIRTFPDFESMNEFLESAGKI